jgi:hypothetical protein
VLFILKKKLLQVRNDKLQTVIRHKLVMGSVLFGKCKILLRVVYNVYVQVKQRENNHALGYGCTRLKSRYIHEYADNYDFELQSVWITAHR